MSKIIEFPDTILHNVWRDQLDITGRSLKMLAVLFAKIEIDPSMTRREKNDLQAKTQRLQQRFGHLQRKAAAP